VTLLVATDASSLDGRKGYGYCVSADEFGYGPLPADAYGELEAVAAVLRVYPDDLALDLVTDSDEVFLRVGLFQPPKRRRSLIHPVVAVAAARKNLSVRRIDPRTGEVPHQSAAHLLAYLGRQLPEYPREDAAHLVRRVLASSTPHAEAKAAVFDLPY
jgi:hypothetical protein